MGDFDLGASASRFSLGDFRLQLDPEIEAQMRLAAAGQAAPRLRQFFVSPDWSSFGQSQLDAMLRTAPATPAPAPAAGPATPRPGQIGDLMGAIWRLQAVQQAADRLRADTERTLRSEWEGASDGERALMITAAATFAGTSLTAILANQPTRELALDFIDGRNLPVPGVPGFTVQLRGRGRGAGAGLSNIAGSGVSVRGGAAATTDGSGVNWDVGVTLDLTRIVPQLR